MAVIVSTPARLRFVVAVWRKSWSRRSRIPARRHAAANAVRGFFHGFPLYRKTRLVSRRRPFHNSKKTAYTSRVIGTYSLLVDDQPTSVVIRFLPMHRHVLGLVHDFPSGTHPSPETLEQGDVSPNLIRPTTLQQGPFSQSGIPHIHVSIPLHSLDDAENAPLAQNLEETFIRNLADSFQLEATEVAQADTRSFNCSGPLPMIAKFLFTLKALFPPESAEA